MNHERNHERKREQEPRESQKPQKQQKTQEPQETRESREPREERPAPRARLTYAFDAYCGWCYAFGPTLGAFAAAEESRIELRVLSGGLFTGRRARPVSAYPHISEADTRIAELTGADFGDGYRAALAAGTTVLDSTEAAIAFAALRRQDPTRSLEFARALQRAWYQDGRGLADTDLHRDLAAELGLDAEAVAAGVADPAVRDLVRREFREVRGLGVTSFPTLLLHTASGVRHLGDALSAPQDLARALSAA